MPVYCVTKAFIRSFNLSLRYHLKTPMLKAGQIM
nr:short-subunit dehydrogenase involved in D-alanine esterification of teichoic acids [Mucilaginibacter sp. X4EP1]